MSDGVERDGIRPGDLVVVTGGGGGFGPPVNREPERIADDVVEGYVSAAVARDVYRVAVRDDGTVDEEATRTLRRS